MRTTPPIILTIAGFDPSSGAGATADLKTIAAHDCYGIACLTALTVQSTAGVGRVQPLTADLVRETLEELAADFGIAAVHVGMLGNAAIVEAVADFLTHHEVQNVVLDPVLKSSSGANLLESGAIRMLIEKLLPLASAITPNIQEAAALTGMAVTNVEQMRAAAETLHGICAKAVVITGGHLSPAVDLLSIATERGVEQLEFSGASLQSASTHGTGCAFATALACRLGQGIDLRTAVPQAKTYVTEAIAKAYPVGKGIGPINHLFSRNS